MDKNWKNCTCENCEFRLGSQCKRFPPTMGEYSGFSPTVRAESYDNTPHEYNSACAEYIQQIINPKEGDSV